MKNSPAVDSKTNVASPQFPIDKCMLASRSLSFCRGTCSKLWNPWAAAILLLGIHAGFLAYSATRHSPTLNEPGHLVAGLSIWKFSRFELYRVNPPLVKMIAALPVMAVEYEEDWSSFFEFSGARPEFAMEMDFIAANGERSIWLFTIARWACIPISLTGGLFCFLWSRELWSSNLAGLISLTLWCFDPNILAHGELITPDCAATSFGLGAGYMFWRWLRQPSWGRAMGAGLLLGIAELTKMTWILLFGLWPLLWCFWESSGNYKSLNVSDSPKADQPSIINDQPARLHSHRSLLTRLSQLTTILLIGLYVLNLGYGLDGTFTQLQEFTFVSSALSGNENPGTPGNRFADSVLAELPIPLPKQYILGIDLQKKDFEDYGQPSYLCGVWKDGGWWYYYIYGLTVKTPHGTQFLLAMAIVLTIHRWWTSRTQHPRWLPVDSRDIMVLLIPAVTVMALVSSQLEFNHHVRYVLPVLGFTFVFVGSVGRAAEKVPQQSAAAEDISHKHTQ